MHIYTAWDSSKKSWIKVDWILPCNHLKKFEAEDWLPYFDSVEQSQLRKFESDLLHHIKNSDQQNVEVWLGVFVQLHCVSQEPSQRAWMLKNVHFNTTCIMSALKEFTLFLTLSEIFRWLSSWYNSFMYNCFWISGKYWLSRCKLSMVGLEH